MSNIYKIYYLLYATYYVLPIDCLLVALDGHMFSHVDGGPGPRPEAPKLRAPRPRPRRGARGSPPWGLGCRGGARADSGRRCRKALGGEGCGRINGGGDKEILDKVPTSWAKT